MSPARVAVERLPGGRARLRARDWPWAPWVGWPALAVGAPLFVGSALGGHAIEGGGAAVFCALGILCLALDWRRRRSVEVERLGGDGLRVAGSEGAGPLRREVHLRVGSPWSFRVEPFPVPEGAPRLDDRGGDLVLHWPAGRLRLARQAGPGWRSALEEARAALAGAVGEDGYGPGSALPMNRIPGDPGG